MQVIGLNSDGHVSNFSGRIIPESAVMSNVIQCDVHTVRADGLWVTWRIKYRLAFEMAVGRSCHGGHRNNNSCFKSSLRLNV